MTLHSLLRPAASAFIVAGLLCPGLGLSQEVPPEADVVTSEAEELRRVREELAQVNQELRQIREEVALSRQEAPSTDLPERVAYGSTVHVKLGENVDEVVVFGDNIEIAGLVVGDATSFGGDIIITETGEVGGDAVSFGGSIRIAEGGSVRGDRVAVGVPGAPVANPAETAQAAGSVAALMNEESLFDVLYRRLVLLLAFGGAGVLMVGLFPNRIGRIAEDIEAHPVRAVTVGTLATGFLALFSLLFAVITLGLGIPVSMVVWVVIGLAWLMGFVGLCQAIGDRLPFESKPQGRWIAFLVGAVLLTCMSSLPLVGWLVVGGASLLGIGAAMSTRLGGR